MYNKKQFACDVRDVRVLKFGRTGSNFWAYLRPTPVIEKRGHMPVFSRIMGVAVASKRFITWTEESRDGFMQIAESGLIKLITFSNASMYFFFFKTCRRVEMQCKRHCGLRRKCSDLSTSPRLFGTTP